MSNRLYAFIPIKKDYKSTEEITKKIKSLLIPGATIRVEGSSIDVISQYNPLYIDTFDFDDSFWEIFVWENWGYVFSEEEEDKSNRRFLRDVCKILGSNECWYCGEIILFDYVICDYDHIDLGRIISNSIEYKECKEMSSWDYENKPFVHDDFSDLD